ncbi:MAG: SufS family cysteine desulfurase [Cyanobacteria bacterium J06597_1]
MSAFSATAAQSAAVSAAIDDLAHRVRPDFPILERHLNDKPLVYLDNAATSQKPIAVLQAMEDYYRLSNANVHRGAHALSREATEAYEASRVKVAKFINATSDREIVYTRNASEAINLVAYTWGMHNLQPGDEIILSVMEHHSNLVPWQFVAQRTGAILKFVTLTETGEFDCDRYTDLLSNRTKLVSTVHVSNTLGCINPVAEIVERAHHFGAKVLIDACQSAPHMSLDVQALNCDWLVASGHKMCAPTGSGFLFGKEDLLLSMPPFLGGGEMIADVELDCSTYADLPHKFEAGTPAIAEAVGLGAAVDYLSSIGMDAIHTHEQQLTDYLLKGLATVDGVTPIGPTWDADGKLARAGLVAFTVEGIHANDIAALLDEDAIAIRSGHHCTQPLHKQLGLSATARASVYFYNARAEIDAFLASLKSTIEFFAMAQ